MMKKAFSIALAAFALMAATSFAQTDTADTKAKTEKTCDLGKSRKFRKADMKTMEARRADRAFEGINLTETQKKEVSALNKRTRAERQAMKAERQAMKAERQKMKAERKADKGADREQRMAQRKAMKEKRIAAKKSYLSQLRNIIGEDNYVIYLENQYIQKYDGNGGRAKMHAGHAKRGKTISKVISKK